MPRHAHTIPLTIRIGYVPSKQKKIGTAICRLSHCRPAAYAASAVMSAKPFCVRCLIREMTDQTAMQQILSYQNQIPDHKKAAAPLYEKRLSICKDCKWLHPLKRSTTLLPVSFAWASIDICACLRIFWRALGSPEHDGQRSWHTPCTSDRNRATESGDPAQGNG